MCLNLRYPFHPLIFFSIAFVLVGCDQISMPRMSFDSEPNPLLPVTVTYAFPEQLVNYTKTVDGCGLPHTIPVGQIIAKTFLQVGINRFHGVRAEPPMGEAKGASPGGYRVVLELQKFEWDPAERTGEEDRYTAFVSMNMQATYEDSRGIPLAKSPLTFFDQMGVYTPALTSTSTSCETTQIDGTVVSAAEVLAEKMVSVMPQLAQGSSPATPVGQPTQPPAGTPGFGTPAPPTPPVPAQSPASASVQFRTKLIDANKNLILEGGEVIVLLVETTNTSQASIPSAYVELGGTPQIIKAFERVAPLPVPIGALKPGQKRTTEIRGRLSNISRETPGELTIGIILSEGLPPGRHTVRVTLSPPLKRSRPKG